MWQRFKNTLCSFGSYADLSPDVQTRRQVHQWLRDRPARSLDEWYCTFWQSQGIARSLVTFVHHQLQEQAELDLTQTRPSDRLVDDLQLPLICWFDWEISLCEEFFNQFGVELFDDFDITHLHTLQDLVYFLHQHLTASSNLTPTARQS
jgi:hypothetical protein